jgi:hypothetical protein
MTDIVDRLRTVDISWSQEGEWCAEAADEIERYRTNQRIIIALFRIYMIRLNPDYSEEEFDKHIANMLEEKE